MTLREWAQIDLRSCDLAILSACETNLGPPQRGEGTWALSRGLLVAGARRVVASNWSVEDESTSELIGAFAEAIANHPKGTLAYARALSAAKRRIREEAGGVSLWPVGESAWVARFLPVWLLDILDPSIGGCPERTLGSESDFLERMVRVVAGKP